MTDGPMAFLSYTRLDDELDNGFITRFRTRLEREVRARIGRPFTIFQDKDAIKWGESWQRQIPNALAEATFLIPVITPNFLRSKPCREEVQQFAEYERQRGRDDLMLGLYYISTRKIDDEELQESDPVAKVIGAHQFEDWRELRGKGFTQPAKNKIIAMAAQIVERMDHVPDTPEPQPETIRVITPPPDLVPVKFRDRFDLRKDLLERLDSPSARAIVLTGEGGMGKTAIAAEVLPWLRERPEPGFDAFDYLSARGHRPMNAATIIQDLVRAVADDAARDRLRERLDTDDLSWLSKIDLVLPELAGTRVLIVIDDAEELLDAAGAIRDVSLRDLVQDLSNRDDHAVRLLLVTSRQPAPLFDGRNSAGPLTLRAGLSSHFVAEFLQGLDQDDTVGLASAEEPDIDRLRERTGGRPRALELVYAVLAGEHRRTLADLLNGMRDVTEEDACHFLLNRLDEHLSDAESLVLRAAAVFGRPVPAPAIGQLLDPHLTSADVPSILTELVRRRLLRCDRDQYYLPPADADHVRSRIKRGVAAHREQDPPPLTRVALLHRAADYFQAEAARTDVRRVDDLGPHFSEIDLRVQCGEWDRALQAMDAIDDAYLARSGHSDVLTPWRKAISTKLTDAFDQLSNLQRAATASGGQDRLKDQTGLLGKAIKRNRDTLQSDRHELTLRLNLAGAYLDGWQVRKAEIELGECLNLSRALNSPVKEALARTGLGICLTATGEFDAAARHLRDGLTIIEQLPATDRNRKVKAGLLINLGELELYQNRTTVAINAFEDSVALARTLGDELLAARAKDAQALAQLDFNAPAKALELATWAANIGVRSGMAEISHPAHQTLALIHFHTRNIEAAAAAARAGARIRRGHRVAGTLALRGIAEFRLGRIEAAQSDFSRTHIMVTQLLRRERKLYSALELNGLALTGLVLCNEPDHRRGAERAYRAAREITRAPGAVSLCMQMLNALIEGSDPKLLEGIENAAMGSTDSLLP